jgi:hypothetical protein
MIDSMNDLEGGLTMIRNADGSIDGVVTWQVNMRRDGDWIALGRGTEPSEVEARQAMRRFSQAIQAALVYNANRSWSSQS